MCPFISGNQSVAVSPKEWKNGSTPIMASFFPRWKTCAKPSALETMLWCVSITPLGLPVLPVVKMMVARASGFLSPQQ